MAVIVVASHKGGVGKTTISLLLAEELSYRGYDVGLVEADKQRHTANYLAMRQSAERAANFELYSDEDAETVGRTIRRADERHDLVVVDLPGMEGLQFTRAAARANLVLIPMPPSTMDANSASRAMEQLAIEEDHLGRQIPVRIVFNMVKDAKRQNSAIGVDHVERTLRDYIGEHGLPRISAELTWRPSGFRRWYLDGKTLREMNDEIFRPGRVQVENSLSKSMTEFDVLTTEILDVLGLPHKRLRAEEANQNTGSEEPAISTVH